jgi:SWI/SNF-related matrix-associated actin-dependent regulator of chromatin subfamily D
MGAVQTLWNYIKIQGLQDKVDRRMIRADERLKPVSILVFCFHKRSANWSLQIFGVEAIPFQQLPEIMMRFLLPPDPIVLHYTLNPSIAPPEKPQVRPLFGSLLSPKHLNMEHGRTRLGT